MRPCKVLGFETDEYGWSCVVGVEMVILTGEDGLPFRRAVTLSAVKPITSTPFTLSNKSPAEIEPD
jgi:hypothetical protein